MLVHICSIPFSVATNNSNYITQNIYNSLCACTCSLTQACGDRSGTWLGIRDRVAENFPCVSKLRPQSSSRCVRFQGRGFLQTFSTFSLTHASFSLRVSVQVQGGEHGRMVLASGGNYGIGITRAGRPFGWVGDATVEVRAHSRDSSLGADGRGVCVCVSTAYA